MCIELPSRYSRASTAHEAIAARHRRHPVAGRRYSGNFRVRMSPELHARLAVEAAEQCVSLNQWVVQKLADRRPTPSLDDLF